MLRSDDDIINTLGTALSMTTSAMTTGVGVIAAPPLSPTAPSLLRYCYNYRCG